MVDRVTSRVAFGKPLAEQGMIQNDIALSRVEIDQARLLCFNAARSVDVLGNKAAKADIGAIKIVAPRMAKAVIDRSIQAHGGMGVSQVGTLIASRLYVARHYISAFYDFIAQSLTRLPNRNH
jgi:acyl-CoA dehydrogenase